MVGWLVLYAVDFRGCLFKLIGTKVKLRHSTPSTGGHESTQNWGHICTNWGTFHTSVIFVNENKNAEKRENNDFVNEN